MKKLIFTLLLAFAFLCTPHFSWGEAMAGTANCDARCVAAKHPQRSKPAVKDEVCVYFIQPQAGTVVLTFTFEGGGTRIYSAIKGADDKFCVGRHWVINATKADLCNKSTGSAVYDHRLPDDELTALAVKPQFSHTLTSCLYGRDECAAMGFKVGP